MAGEKGEQTAESWLLPELGEAQVVPSERRHAGFNRLPGGGEQASARTLRGPFTQGRLEELAREARERGHDDGRAEGYQKGYAEGEARARETGLAQTEALRQQLQSLVDSLGVQVSATRKELEAALVEVVKKLVRAICLRELGDAAEKSIPAIVERALAALPLGEQHISLRMHPDDIALLREQPGLVKSQWQLVDDQDLSRGDVVLDSEFSHVDATLARRMDDLVENLFQQGGPAETGQPE